MARQYTVTVNGAAPTSATGGLREIYLYGQQANFRFNHKWAAKLPRQLTVYELDWLTLLEAIFAADRACPRGGQPSNWARDIRLAVPVRRPAFWNEHLTRLQELFSDLTWDALRLEVLEDTDPLPAPRTSRQQYDDFDSVALLSGGIDSLIGGAQLLMGDRHVLFLSHSQGGTITRAQRAAAAALRGLGPAQFCEFTARPWRSGVEVPFVGPRLTDQTERSRTLLYIGVAALIAGVGGAHDVFVNENGIMAIHTPISAARMSSYSTKSAAPSVLRQLSTLIASVFGAAVNVRNALVGHTKAEVVAWAQSNGLSNEIKATVSCWSISRRRLHCGACVPCIIRRLSCLWQGVDDVDYEIDIFHLPANAPEWAIDNQAHYATFAADLIALSDSQLEVQHGELLEEDVSFSASDSIDMHRRWGQQIRDVLDGLHPPPEGW